MLYYFLNYLKTEFKISIIGGGMFQFITFRVTMALLLSLVISLLFGKWIIRFLQRKQIGETIRDLGLQGENSKKGTPTMGGLIILSAIVIPTLLFAQLANVYIWLILLSTVWLGLIGFLDDYIKVFKKNKEGLAGRFKIMGQVGLGLIIGTTLYFNNDVVVSREVIGAKKLAPYERQISTHPERVTKDGHRFVDVKTPITTIPFVKNHEFNYSKLISWIPGAEKYTFILYILIVIFIITAVSNGANLTDGLDGLATGVSGIIGIGLGIFAYVSGNIQFAEYLNIMYIPNLGELSIFIAAFVGGCVGFLWYNAYPAQVFMGDTGSLALGGIIAALSIIVRKELLIPIFCGVFLVESVSVMVQVSYFKYTKKKYGEGRRLLKMSPLHHHYQKLGYHESKISVRFWIVTIMCVVTAIATLKMR
ncbi:Phospho-N-acetylmuramoyl-pentapeptide-transferase [Chitinophaga terrae (ex Kim and Jung 2007)]|jgi:phospho-N-acetylmuramoyl-pentapeptide-transferase|uniref:Phospho-N-acetylmuramoyl-pentapeptide-transferase n=1 Tax=Chitinophaga terrae (ex Kim and Jung 2007) TaxID=408074 RepID=A0A1H4DLW8_9BACT|nr:phospho-N-acetylmuramoyl-pentapeptide-transferase [Chitinophaga terrae (ex Kim and Jung 2007)]MDQ0107809.1 phospho-N-acetylmuramoyl-pentapeptide-transferase [Chitinophaga terrae (ex Kim and Jung 2007)]GEP90983.1 phospho-N-acetylmuramoyl-pentapeptide-transferase [Chitinophaga terrae (ex Kim and Jung 2007)]SEA73597.1 Phospho-N-acetylmuramoyl-pentapeptide-transferase [Chitinophaga terrae (ex Kim and Jung 2007)]